MFSNRTSPSFQRQARSRLSSRCLSLVLALLATIVVCAGASQAQSQVATAEARPTTSSAGFSVEDVVKLVAQRKLWPLKAEAAEDQLRALGPWKREQPIAEALTLLAGRAGVVEHSELSYAADVKKRWTFVGASFFVGDPDLARLHHTLSDLLQHQLGRPAWTRKAQTSKGDLPAVGLEARQPSRASSDEKPSGRRASARAYCLRTARRSW
jgi:hypothetical protein